MAAKKRRTRRKRKGHYITGIYESRSGATYKYRSGWELQYMKFLDESEKVFAWTYESVAIPYISNVRTGKVRKYYPDFQVFWLDGHDELIEIKPARRVKQATVQKKLKAAEVWCREHQVTLVVLTEVELKGLGLLK